MRETLRQAVLSADGRRMVLLNWTDSLLEKHAELKEKARVIQTIESRPLRFYAENKLEKLSAEFASECTQWADHMEREHDSLTKEAGIGETATSFLANVTDTATKVGTLGFIGVPTIAGIALAYAKNKITSPSKESMKNAQRELYLNAMKKRLATMKRQRSLKEEEKKKESMDTKQRSIRIM